MARVILWVHCVWATKSRQPFISMPDRPAILKHIKDNARAKGIHIDFINAHINHVHCLISLNPDQSIAKVIQLIKGESSHWINRQLAIKGFEWCDEYYAASISYNRVNQVRNYIRDQDRHHETRSWPSEESSFRRAISALQGGDSQAQNVVRAPLTPSGLKAGGTDVGGGTTATGGTGVGGAGVGGTGAGGTGAGHTGVGDTGVGHTALKGGDSQTVGKAPVTTSGLKAGGWALLTICALQGGALAGQPRSLTTPLLPGAHNSTPVTACTGYNPSVLTFTTPPSGGRPPYSYQWKLNGNTIAGATLSSYDPPQLAAPGMYRYNCVVTDSEGASAYTAEKPVTIVPDPSVSVSGGGTICMNTTILLTSTITGGTGSNAYQWESAPAATGPWTAIAGATAPAYAPPASIAGTQYYHLLINPSASSCNSTVSAAVAVTVTPPLVLGLEPASQSDCKLNSIIFSAVISGGTPPITFTWQRKRPSDGGFSVITGDPDITYPSPGFLHADKIGSPSNPNGTQYRVVISDACGNSITSVPATLTVHEIISIYPPTNLLKICAGTTLTYTVTTGSPPLSWRWIRDGMDLNDGGAYSGTTTSSLIITGTSISNSGRYQVRVVFAITVPNNNGGGVTTCTETSTLDRVLQVYPQPATSLIYHN